mgnify:CR=1 FL=1
MNMITDQTKLEALGANPSPLEVETPITLNVMMHPVESSNLALAGYNDFLGLVVQFKTGAIYAYRDVTRETYHGLLAAESKGKFFNEHVKNAGFDFVRVR